MERGRICAVVVSYQGADTVGATLSSILGQVDAVRVVDNGSDEPTKSILTGLARELRVTVTWNGPNLGLASALNQGVRWAIENGFRYVLTMDQDSVAAEGLVDRLLEAIEQDGGIGIAAPRSVESVNGRVYGLGATEGRAGAVRFVKLVHSSGSLIPARVFERAGLFRENLFIDQVDYEFCLRLRKGGLRIAIVDRARLWHRLGSISTTQVLWKTLHCANYSRERHYYQARNRIAVGRLHKDLSYIRSQADSMAREICKIVLCERGKMRKLQAVAKGVLDGMRGRMGKWNG